MPYIPQMEPSYDGEEIKTMTDYFKSGGWGGEFIQTEKLEKMICKLTGAKYCSMTINGTVSLTLAMIALGLKQEDEILVPDMTMIASPNSAKLIGVKPILVDIEPETLCVDLTAAEKCLTRKTKALMYVAFNGRSGNMDKVKKFCKIHNLFLIEDAAQALGSYYKGKHLGTFGDIGSFSFSVPKIITTGQGGALITNNKSLYKRIEKIKDFGRIKSGIDVHNLVGWNFKFNDFLAIIGIAQMKKLKKRIEFKKSLYQKIVTGLKDVPQIKFISTNLNDTSPWFIDIYVKNRTKLINYLKSKNIGTRVIYPAINRQVVYQNEYREKLFPVTEKIAGEGLWLPSSVNLSNIEINYIIDNIRKFYSNSKKKF